MVAWRRGGAFCKGIVSTARRGGLPFAPAKGSKTGQRGTKLSPLQTPLTLKFYLMSYLQAQKLVVLLLTLHSTVNSKD